MKNQLIRRFREFVQNNPEIRFRQRTRQGREYITKGLGRGDTFTPSVVQLCNKNTCVITGMCEIFFREGDGMRSDGLKQFQTEIKYNIINPNEEQECFDFEILEVINNLIEIR